MGGFGLPVKEEVHRHTALNGDREPHGILRRGLPYADNLPVVLLTAAINLACVFIFYYGREIDLKGVLTDSFYCGVITPFINVFVIGSCVARLRALGSLPAAVPVNALMMRLPKNKFLLALLFAAVFGPLTPLVNLALIRFYGITNFGFAQLALWKVVYSCLLSAKIIELTILRYVQPDCGTAREREQHGAGAVKDPLPRVSVFKEWFNTVTDDFGFNMLSGLLFGGTVIEGYNVIIPPTARSGIAITSVILGLIVAARMAYPVAKNIKAAADAAGPPEAGAPRNRGLSLLPAAPWKFALALAIPIILASFAVFWSVMAFFRFDELNFFQFFLIRVIFVSLLSKAVVRLAIRRYFSPPDVVKE